jgi:hypothetical protein
VPPRGSLAGSDNRVDGGRDQPYFNYPFLGGTKDGPTQASLSPSLSP